MAICSSWFSESMDTTGIIACPEGVLCDFSIDLGSLLNYSPAGAFVIAVIDVQSMLRDYPACLWFFLFDNSQRFKAFNPDLTALQATILKMANCPFRA